MNEERKRFIVPPADEILKRRLILKLEEYKKRMLGEGEPWEFQHPELAYQLHDRYRDAYYKAYILKKVLESDEPVDIHKLHQEISSELKDNFILHHFSTALGVIREYCNHSRNELLIGGTGLPELSKMAEPETLI